VFYVLLLCCLHCLLYSSLDVFHMIFYKINFMFFFHTSFHVACACVICLLKYLLTYLLTKMQVNVRLCCKLNKLAMIMNGQWTATSLHARSVRAHSCRCQGPDMGSACHLMALIDTTCDGHLERLIKLPDLCAESRTQ